MTWCWMISDILRQHGKTILLLVCLSIFQVGCIKQGLVTMAARGERSEFIEYIQSDPGALSNVSLEKCSLQNLQLNDVVVSNLSLTDVDFSNSDLTKVTFTDCEFSNVDFSKGRFHDVRFVNSTLKPVGSTRQDIEETSFNGALFDRVGFKGCELFDVTMHELQKGSSLALVDSTLLPVIQGNSSVFKDSYLDKLLVDGCVSQGKLLLSLGILGNGVMVFKNNSFELAILRSVNAQKIQAEQNKNCVIGFSGSVKELAITNNENTDIGYCGNFNTIVANNNFGEKGRLGLTGKGRSVMVTDSISIAVAVGDIEAENVVISNGRDLAEVLVSRARVGKVSISNVVTDELSFFRSTIGSLTLDNVTVKKKSGAWFNKIANKEIRNVVLGPNFVLYKLKKDEAKAFWDELLPKLQ